MRFIATEGARAMGQYIWLGIPYCSEIVRWNFQTDDARAK
jgi:hypothetical protein